jgi:hypothetical protein
MRLIEKTVSSCSGASLLRRHKQRRRSGCDQHFQQPVALVADHGAQAHAAGFEHSHEPAHALRGT